MTRKILLKEDLNIKGELWPAGEYTVPDDMTAALADWLVRKRPDIAAEVGGQRLTDFMPEEEPEKPAPQQIVVEPPKVEAKPEAKPKEEPPKPEEKKVEIDPELAGWLSSKGFTRTPEGVAFVRTEKLETGDVVKLQVDFSDTPKGTRYGYRLDLQSDPPEWKSDPALRDHPTLLEFKRFRDDLPAQREERVQTPLGAKFVEVPTAEGQVLMQREAEAMEAKDDQQILVEMKGDFKAEVLKQLFYSFESAGRRVVGLSYKGVKQMAMRQGHIEVKELELKESEKAWTAICKARDKAKDLEVYGVAIQPKEIILRDGGRMPDNFALIKAVSKCQRNALRGLISEVVITEAYKRWLEERGG